MKNNIIIKKRPNLPPMITITLNKEQSQIIKNYCEEKSLNLSKWLRNMALKEINSDNNKKTI